MSTALAVAVALALATGATSKLGVVLVGADDATSAALLAACPAVIVLTLPSDSAAATQLKNYRTGCPGGIAIAHVGDDNLPVTGTATDAQLGPGWMAQVDGLEASAGQIVNAIEGPSEPVAADTVLAAFWGAFADRVRAKNRTPVVGALPPASQLAGAGSGSDIFCATAQSVVQGQPLVWWSYHARSPTMTTDPTTEASTTLGFRQVRADCGLSGDTLVVTAAGPSSRAWQTSDQAWLSFVDAQATANPGVVGVALSSAGTGSGTTSLSPVQTALVAILTAPPPDAGVADGGGGTGGSVGGSGGLSGPLTGGAAPKACSCGGPAAMLALFPLLALRRRSRRHAVKDRT